MTNDGEEYELTLADAAKVIDRRVDTLIEWAVIGRPDQGVLPVARAENGLRVRLADVIAFAARDLQPRQRDEAADLAVARAARLKGGKQLAQLTEKQQELLTGAFRRPLPTEPKHRKRPAPSQDRQGDPE